MNLVIDLPPQLENALATEATQLGLPLPEYVVRVLRARQETAPAPRNGAELVAYWESEGVIGMRPDIEDSQAHARVLREQAKRRGRS